MTTESSIALVVKSWKCVTQRYNYEKDVGGILFRNLFQLSPNAQRMFGFGKGLALGSEEMYKTEKFDQHVIGVINTLNHAVTLLENGEVDTLKQQLTALGIRHAEYEAKDVHYDLVGKAWIMTLETVLDSEMFTKDVQLAWEDVYFNIIAGTMQQGAKEYFEDDPTTVTTIERIRRTWNKVKTIPKYEQVAGEILLRYMFTKIPEAQNKFGFGKDLPIGSEELYKKELFQRHAIMVIQALDKTIGLHRHNNMEYAKPYLYNLGTIHAEHDTTKEQYQIFGDALNFTVAKIVGSDNFTTQDKLAWKEWYDQVSKTMMEGVSSFA